MIAPDTPSSTNAPIQIGNILITHDRLAQLDQSHTVASVAREDFVSAEITFQRVCKQPLILSLIASGMILFGLMTVRGIIEWLVYGGRTGIYSIMMVLLFPGGLAFLYQAWRQAPMLIIETHKGTRRLEFKGNYSNLTINALERAARERGYAMSCGPGPWN